MRIFIFVRMYKVCSVVQQLNGSDCSSHHHCACNDIHSEPVGCLICLEVGRGLLGGMTCLAHSSGFCFGVAVSLILVEET